MEDGASGSPSHDRGDAADRSRPAPVPASPLAAELERARERIAFYESFDRLIQENIARSGDLMRQAAEQRETAVREVAAIRGELDRRLADQRAVLMLLGEGLVGLQEHMGALARHVADALDALDAAEPAATSGLEGTALGEPTAAETGSLPSEDAAGGAPVMAEASAEHGEPDDLPAPPPVAEDTALDNPAPAQGAAPRPIELVVHGVPRAATALSLQRHLHELDYVEAVEAREYAAGVLRLQVVTRVPLALDDLRRWAGGAGLEPVTVRADVVEVKLPGAEGF